MFKYNPFTQSLDNAGGSSSDPIASATKVVAASDSLDTSRADYVCDGTADDVQINEAITAIATKGGSVVLLEGTYNIAADITIGASNISLIGSNSEATILNFANSTYRIVSSGTIAGISIERLKLKDCKSLTGSINLVSVSRPVIRDCNFANAVTTGNGNITDIKLYSCVDSKILNNVFTTAQTNGYSIFIGNNSNRFLVSGNTFLGGASGLSYVTVGDNGAVSEHGVVSNNICTPTTACERFLKSNSTDSYYMSVVGNHCYGQFHFCYDTNSRHMYIFGNTLYSTGTSTGSEGIVARQDCVVVGNAVKGTELDNPILISNINNTVVGNTGKVVDITANARSMVMGNYGSSEVTDQKVVKMKNADGSNLTLGTVVTLYKSGACDEVVPASTASDELVFGMALATIEPAAYGDILVYGKTTSLKVSGTDDIAVGDFLTTSITSGVATFAGATDVVFAIALEAYTEDDANGVIDALLIAPRIKK